MDVIVRDTDRDNYMTAEEAKAYGLIDQVYRRTLRRGMSMARKMKVRCSFCGKTESQVMKLLKGPNGVYICDACVELCSEIIEEEMNDEEERNGCGGDQSSETGGNQGISGRLCDRSGESQESSFRSSLQSL